MKSKDMTTEEDSFIKQRWYEFRSGHNLYLSFAISLTNFLLIAYNFLIANLSKIELWQFVVLAILFYVPTAIIVGRVHRKKQLDTDARIAYKVIIAEIKDLKKIVLEKKRKEA